MTFLWWFAGAAVVAFSVMLVGVRTGRGFSPGRKRIHMRKFAIAAYWVLAIAVFIFPIPYVSSSVDPSLKSPSEVSGVSDPEQTKALTREVESLRSDLYELRSHLNALSTLAWVFIFTLGIQYLLTPNYVNREEIDKNPLNLNDYRQD